MSSSLIDRSPDLKALTEAGYPLELHGAYLFVRNVPYLYNSSGRLARADMVMSIDYRRHCHAPATIPSGGPASRRSAQTAPAWKISFLRRLAGRS